MTRIRYKMLNIMFVLMIYVFTISALLIAGELRSSAASGPLVDTPMQVEQLRPIAPQRNISAQRMAPLTFDDELLPFWSR